MTSLSFLGMQHAVSHFQERRKVGFDLIDCEPKKKKMSKGEKNEDKMSLMGGKFR